MVTIWETIFMLKWLWIQNKDHLEAEGVREGWSDTNTIIMSPLALVKIGIFDSWNKWVWDVAWGPSRRLRGCLSEENGRIWGLMTLVELRFLLSIKDISSVMCFPKFHTNHSYCCLSWFSVSQDYGWCISASKCYVFL